VFRFILLLFVSALTALPVELVPGRYIVELQDEPVLDSPRGSVRFASKDARRQAVRSAQARVRAAAEQNGVVVWDTVENVANALLVEGSDAEVAALESTPGVKRVRPVKLYRALLDRAASIHKVHQAWDLVGGRQNAGGGIKIAIIDTGIDPSQPGFQDMEMKPPDGFPKLGVSADMAYSNNKVIVVRNYDRSVTAAARDQKGHGTGVAMAAAGRNAIGPYGEISGFAPKAFLGSYKVFPDGSEGAPDDGILKAIDDAIADGMDIINLSLGSYPAENPADDLIASAVERASAAGVIVVVAAGNDGPDTATVSSPATAASVIAVGNAYSDRAFGVAVQVDGGPQYFSVPGSGPNSGNPVTGTLRDIAELDPSGLACAALPADSLRGTIPLVLRGECLFSEKLANVERAGAVAAVVYTHADSPNPITMSVADSRLPAVMISNTDGLTLKSVLKERGQVSGSLAFPQQAVTIDAARVGDSSSKGPSVDNGIKPEVLAVGTHIYTGAPGSRPTFQVATGTSLASPIVAGAAAVLKAARPGLTVAQYKSLLVNSASIFNVASGVVPIQQGGAGILDVEAALKISTAVSPSVLGFGAGSGTFEKSQTLTLSNVSKDPARVAINVLSFGPGPTPELSRPEVELAPGGSESVTVNFRGNGAGPGEYSGMIIVQDPNGEVKIPYWYAVGMDRASNIAVVDANPSAANSTSSRQIYLVRPTDPYGLAIEARPTVTVEKGDGTLIGVRQSSIYPGFYQVDLRLGATTGENVFLIEAAGAQKRVTITSN
jgi:subtilisin family serine protease